MAVTIRAMFLGSNGSMGFIKGEVYILTIHENRIVSPKHCPYDSTEAFLRNWLPLAEKQELSDVQTIAALGDKHLRKGNL